MAVFSGRLLLFFLVAPDANTFVKTLKMVRIVTPWKPSTPVTVLAGFSLLAKVFFHLGSLVRTNSKTKRNVQPNAVVIGVLEIPAALATYGDVP